MLGAIHVDLTRDVLDWVLVGVAVLTSGATIGAVAAAVLSPLWHERRKRPKLRVGPDPPSVGYSLNLPEPAVMRLRLANEPGRDTAEAVGRRRNERRRYRRPPEEREAALLEVQPLAVRT